MSRPDWPSSQDRESLPRSPRPCLLPQAHRFGCPPAGQTQVPGSSLLQNFVAAMGHAAVGVFTQPHCKA